jgi:hypothetical protein
LWLRKCISTNEPLCGPSKNGVYQRFHTGLKQGLQIRNSEDLAIKYACIENKFLRHSDLYSVKLYIPLYMSLDHDPGQFYMIVSWKNVNGLRELLRNTKKLYFDRK